MLKTIIQLFVAFFKASILSYGGGPSSIPLMRTEVVDTYKWFTNEEFADALAIGNTLPGPIAPKMAAYIGNNVAGVLGAVTGVVATVVPTAIAIVLIAKFLLSYKDSPRLQGMLKAAKPVVVVMLLQAALVMMNKTTYASWTTYILSAVAFVALIVLKINPAIVMFAGLAFGFVFNGIFK